MSEREREREREAGSNRVHCCNSFNQESPLKYQHVSLPINNFIFNSLTVYSYPETGCITMMKAMACGAIPITSRFESSVLQDLTRVPSTSSTPSSSSTITSSTTTSSTPSSSIPTPQTISTIPTPTATATAINDFPQRDYNDFSQRDYDDFDMGPRRALTDSIAQDPAQYQQWVSHTETLQHSTVEYSALFVPCLSLALFTPALPCPCRQSMTAPYPTSDIL